MQTMRERAAYVLCGVFAYVCIAFIYGYAALLSVLELARLIRPIYPRPAARPSCSSQPEQQPMLFGSLVDK